MTFDGKNNLRRWWCPLAAILFLLTPGLASNAPVAIGDEMAGQANALADYSMTTNTTLNILGSWIWDAVTSDGQTCQFWRAFDIPPDDRVIQAKLLMTVDNEFTLFLDGRELGRGAEWRELFNFNLTLLMTPGRHVLAVKAYNSFSYAGMLLGLRIDLADGKRIEIKSDQSWRVVPNEARGWKEMTSICN